MLDSLGPDPLMPSPSVSRRVGGLCTKFRAPCCWFSTCLSFFCFSVAAVSWVYSLIFASEESQVFCKSSSSHDQASCSSVLWAAASDDSSTQSPPKAWEIGWSSWLWPEPDWLWWVSGMSYQMGIIISRSLHLPLKQIIPLPTPNTHEMVRVDSRFI